MDRRTTDAIFIELLSQMVSAVFGTGKHQHLLPVPFTNHVRQQFAFAFLINKVNVLGHLIRRGIAACHFDFQRVVRRFPQGFDIRQRRSQRTAGSGVSLAVLLTRNGCRLDKAHVEHAVSFIEDEDFNLIQLHCILMFQYKLKGLPPEHQRRRAASSFAG